MPFAALAASTAKLGPRRVSACARVRLLPALPTPSCCASNGENWSDLTFPTLAPGLPCSASTSRSGRIPPATPSGIGLSWPCSNACECASTAAFGGAPRSRSRFDGDLRAWDAEISGRDPRPWRARVEGETRIADGQALERKLALKLRDDPGGHLILLVADTRANRRALAALGPGLREMLPFGPREIFGALDAGHEPPGSGIVVL